MPGSEINIEKSLCPSFQINGGSLRTIPLNEKAEENKNGYVVIKCQQKLAGKWGGCFLHKSAGKIGGCEKMTELGINYLLLTVELPALITFYSTCSNVK
jgi:hypothetical protein